MDIDALSLLLSKIEKVYVPGPKSRVFLLNPLLRVLTDFVVRTHNSLGENFNQRPIFRLLVNLLHEICGPVPTASDLNVQVGWNYTTVHAFGRGGVL